MSKIDEKRRKSTIAAFIKMLNKELGGKSPSEQDKILIELKTIFSLSRGKVESRSVVFKPRLNASAFLFISFSVQGRVCFRR